MRKARASAFFGTHLITYLVRKNIDCLLVTGTSTCGCVRGTVLDGYSSVIRFSSLKSASSTARALPIWSTSTR